MSEIFPENIEPEAKSGLDIIRNPEFQIALANANYELNVYMDDPDQRIDEIRDEISNFFPEDADARIADFMGMGYEYDGDAVTDKRAFSISNADYLGVKIETIDSQEKIVLQFLLPDSDYITSGEYFCVDPVPEDVAMFDFREEFQDIGDEFTEKLSKLAHTMQSVVRSKDFLNLSLEEQQETLEELSVALTKCFDFLRTDSRSILGVKCLGYYCSPTELSDELDLDEYYIDLGDNPDISHFPEGKLMDIGLPEKFLNHDKRFTVLDDLYFSGGVPYIVLKPPGLDQYYWINIREIDGVVWSIDSPSQLESGMSE